LKVVDEFSTLINPERYIPAHISRLTGITNEMVREAPRFWEVAKKIVLLTENKTFVAHNASFDYNFIKQEFKELGYDFSREKLCTVKLSRKLIPGKRSYSLGKICRELNISISDRHRAYGDAFATARLLDYLLKIEKKNSNNKKQKQVNNRFTNYELIDHLPTQTGVYYFHNHDGEIIYIGKSKNIRSRVQTHFNQFSSERSLRMLEQIYDITYEITGSELIALLKESQEIKEHQPVFNKAQRRKSASFFICHRQDQCGYIHFFIDKKSQGRNVVASFSSFREAREYLFRLCENNNLCQKLCGLYESAGACFDFQIKKCLGACIKEESPVEYNKRAQRAIDLFHFKNENFFIIDSGRSEDENSVVKVQNGQYIGYGFFNPADMNGQPDLLHDVIQTFHDNREIRRIINAYLHHNKGQKVLVY
jgi:DNA polymerase-3 subunit epsilon